MYIVSMNKIWKLFFCYFFIFLVFFHFVFPKVIQEKTSFADLIEIVTVGNTSILQNGRSFKAWFLFCYSRSFSLFCSKKTALRNQATKRDFLNFIYQQQTLLHYTLTGTIYRKKKKKKTNSQTTKQTNNTIGSYQMTESSESERNKFNSTTSAHEDCLEILLKHGADPTLGSLCPLFWAISYRNCVGIQFLLEYSTKNVC
jgi:hypothetical protein